MKKLQIITAVIFGLGISCFLAKILTEFFERTGSYMEPDGTLIEPFFFLLPIGLSLIKISLLLILVQAIFYFVFRSRRNSNKNQ